MVEDESVAPPRAEKVLVPRQRTDARTVAREGTDLPLGSHSDSQKDQVAGILRRLISTSR